jgi:hypothetical protein
MCALQSQGNMKNKFATTTNNKDGAQGGIPNTLFTTVIWIASFNQFSKFYFLMKSM